MIFLQPSWIVAFCCAFLFFGAGKQNTTVAGGKDHSFLWAGLSIAVSALVIRFLDAGWLHVVVAQAVLFVGIGAVRSMLGPR
jgi:hypothetical protein